MTNQANHHIADYLQLFQGTIRPLYLYHLARCGDWQAAEGLTAETMRLGRDWYVAKGLDGETPSEWLYGLAVAVQAQFRR